MHEKAIKIVHLLPKHGSFQGKKIVHLFVCFLAKLGAHLSSELLTTLAEFELSFLSESSRRSESTEEIQWQNE